MKEEKICFNCEHAMSMNMYFEDINGELCPCNSYVCYCAELDDYVCDDDTCDAWVSCLEYLDE